MDLTRRDWMAATAAGVVLSGEANAATATEFSEVDPGIEPFGYCLNTSTISGQNTTGGTPVSASIIGTVAVHGPGVALSTP